MCAQVVTMVEYDASFEKEEPYRLEVQHNGQQVETIEHPDYSSEAPGNDENPGNQGVLTGLFSWLGSLF